MAAGARRGPYICGIDAGMDVVTGKWKSLILWELHNYGTRRFGELRRGLPGVSEKMLVQHLREMEEDGLLDRKVYPEVPPRVEYSLTPHGISLNEALRALGSWGQQRVKRLAAEGSLIEVAPPA
ncbi:DNA-binding HxlR family transcriptional regulator [Actinoplanes octamycinicus]|uniref:DNA-binding HxlR family transcriptional regulator n=1 Tax=Actinoplanes octamycinicus TaxID=135948 RepID=A0A7W7MBC4_9ACTN|nr:helix-turn-helix domain-containing protein [Actinoplanes octamycinicus]MBB4743973.1 DNA-binding HxlR family transcriptional regulator [Actinoplanes octamycinicus]GIE58596.1 transcriptional regulator [Actinoplanes octamycinicus]